MTEHEPGEDELWMARLSDAFGVGVPPTDSAVDMVMVGYALVNLDVVTADRVLETETLEGASHTRGDDRARVLTFAADDLVFEMEVSDARPQVVGRVVPGRQGTVHLDQLGNELRVEVDDLGWFEFDQIHRGPFRVRFVSPERASVATEWIDHDEA